MTEDEKKASGKSQTGEYEAMTDEEKKLMFNVFLSDAKEAEEETDPWTHEAIYAVAQQILDRQKILERMDDEAQV